MGRVFISYSRKDTETVDRIANVIQGAGLDVWLDRHNIRAGNEWRVQIVQAIDTCDAFVLMLSPNSAASENVRKEIDLAQDSQRRLFVIMLEPVKLPAEIRYQLAGLQFVDVQLMGVDEASHLLVDTLKEHIATLQPKEEPKVQQAELVIQGIDLVWRIRHEPAMFAEPKLYEVCVRVKVLHCVAEPTKGATLDTTAPMLRCQLNNQDMLGFDIGIAFAN